MKSVLFVCLTVFVSANCSMSYAQELLAPSRSATFAIGCIETGEDGSIHVIQSEDIFDTRNVKGDYEDDPYVTVVDVEESELKVDDVNNGMMQMIYTVSVPYSEMVTTAEGNTVTVQKVRTETRTRMIAVEDASSKKLVSYKTRVPYSEAVQKDGLVMMVQKFREETRTRAIFKYEELVRRRAETVSKVSAENVSFFQTDGTAIPREEAMKMVSERRPVVLLAEKDQVLDSFYAALLNPETLVIYVDQ